MEKIPKSLKALIIVLLKVIFYVYLLGLVITAPFYNWKYAQKNGFGKWLLVGGWVSTAQSIVWPYYAFEIKDSVGSLPSKITAIDVNDVALDLINLFHDGKIEESSKKDAFMAIMAGQLYEQFNEIDYGFRIKECSEKWRFFEDGKYRILVGSVYKNKNESSIFVWLWEGAGEKQKVIYLSLGNEVIVGKEYPKGIIPYKK
ncbi:MAG: hypothetical protein ACK5JP_07930 [Akkermansiaceae bacterium]